MRRVAFLFFTFYFLIDSSFSQTTIKGIIKDAETKTVLAAASIFIATSKIGTVSSSTGAFSLDIPQGKYDLIVSNIGYETQVININEKKSDELIIYLKQKQKELDNVQVIPYEKDGWKKWGNFFLNSFIGTMSYASKCVLKNHEVIKFRNNKKRNELSAVAFEPLIVENKALGYVLKYQLEKFIYNFSTGVFYYQGYPLFSEMEGSEKEKSKWEKNRETAYYGSMLHFMRALYRNKLPQEGFEIHKLVRKENTEKKRVKLIVAMGKQYQDPDVDITFTRNDSSIYYENVMKQPDELTFFNKSILPSDSIAYAINSTTAGLYFKDYLVVIYTKQKAPYEYTEHSIQKDDRQISQITMLDDREVIVSANGTYYPSQTIFTTDYWAWSEKIGFMLPLDYWPKNIMLK